MDLYTRALLIETIMVARLIPEKYGSDLLEIIEKSPAYKDFERNQLRLKGEADMASRYRFPDTTGQ